MGKIIDLNNAKSKTRKKKIITDIIFGAVTLYILYAVYLIVKTPTETTTVERGTLTVEESATGYIVRNEKYYS